MKSTHFSAVLLAFAGIGASAQSIAGIPAVSPVYSSSLLSSANPDTAPEPAASAALASSSAAQAIETAEGGMRPFHSVGVEAKVGTGGIGFEVGTPLNRFLTLRSGAQFFSDSATIVSDGISTNASITLRNVQASVDVFPFRHSSFHLSGGIAIYNDNHISGATLVPGGQTFTLGDQDYTSDPTNPITGTESLKFGNRVAPRFALGFGSVVPRGHHNFSVPVEIGFEYTAAPTIQLLLSGNGCDQQGCGPINQGTNEQNIQAEVQDLQNDISGLRFFPIVSIGFSYRFGH